MLIVKIIAVLLGLAFALFGYFIYFRKQYHLINGFQAEFEAGRKNTDYARRVGKIEFALGIVLLAGGIALILFV